MNAIELERRYSAHNYAPLPVVLTRGKGAHLWDTAGRRYVDMMSAYSAASHGHGHPRILAALTAQAERLAVPSRAYYNDRLGAFLEELCTLTSLDAATNALAGQVPHEMLLLDLYGALRPLDEITGATTTDDILNLIFSTFCIGK